MKLTGPFAQTPIALMEDHRCSPADKLVWSVMSSFSDDHGLCYPSVCTISKQAGISMSTVRRSLQTLQRTRWISRLHLTALRTTLYRLSGYVLGQNDWGQGQQGTIHATMKPVLVQNDLERTRTPHEKHTMKPVLVQNGIEGASKVVIMRAEGANYAKLAHNLYKEKDSTSRVKKKMLPKTHFDPETGKFVGLDEAFLTRLRMTNPKVDVDTELPKAEAYAMDNVGTKKGVKNVRLFLVNWMCSPYAKRKGEDAVLVQGKTYHINNTGREPGPVAGMVKPNPAIKDIMRKVRRSDDD
jgi:hypothetical protein